MTVSIVITQVTLSFIVTVSSNNFKFLSLTDSLFSLNWSENMPGLDFTTFVNILPKLRYFECKNGIQIGYKSYSVISFSQETYERWGTSWISGKGRNLRKGGVDLEKGGVWNPLPTMDASAFFELSYSHRVFSQTIGIASPLNFAGREHVFQLLLLESRWIERHLLVVLVNCPTMILQHEICQFSLKSTN